jgi:V/A-type H+/Na+-transporting ATPase subunit I
MVVPMKKYSFLIHHKDYSQFLYDMQELGAVDIVDKGVEPDDETTRKILKLQQIEKVIKFLKPKEIEDTSGNTDIAEDEILNSITSLQQEFESIKQKINVLDKSLRGIRPWGNFSVELLQKLENEGFFVRFFIASDKKFNPDWESQYNLEIINRTEGQVFFVIIQRENEQIEIDAEELKALDRSAGEVEIEKAQLQKRMEEIEHYYQRNAGAFIPKLEKLRSETDNSISFERVVQNTGKEAEDRLMIVEGWVPKLKIKEVDSFLAEQEVFHVIDNPVKGEKVPVLLKNNRFSKLFEPITKLYALPDYAELDLTPFFAPFFMLFFGFCLGDAGYGLLFLIGTIILKPRLSKEFHPIVSLVQWLGGATVLFGVLTGTFFGINVIDLIDQGKLQGLSNVRAYMLDPNRMFNAALILGGVQIVYGMVIKTVNLIRQYGINHALDTIGWILLIVGGVILYAISNKNNQELISILFYVLLAISGILILFLNTPGKNIFFNFGVGLWNVYNSASGLLGDLLSYIRLFALGVSSAILGYVFNVLALEMSGTTPVVSQIIFLLIILVGHGLNIFMASIGAFVHPMRLTFLEFYKNAGFSGGGKAYNPFIKK